MPLADTPDLQKLVLGGGKSAKGRGRGGKSRGTGRRKGSRRDTMNAEEQLERGDFNCASKWCRKVDGLIIHFNSCLFCLSLSCSAGLISATEYHQIVSDSGDVAGGGAVTTAGAGEDLQARDQRLRPAHTGGRVERSVRLMGVDSGGMAQGEVVNRYGMTVGKLIDQSLCVSYMWRSMYMYELRAYQLNLILFFVFWS